ncbi:MAG: Eco57I restriction-modification methylase domain-containing protein [Pseudomonadota bacterium]
MAKPGKENDKHRDQLVLPFGPIRNSEFLSNHWLEHRLPLEPEWNELEEAAGEAAERLVELWRTEQCRVEKYGDEAGLEEKFIQPVFEILGWKLKYQTFLQGREPDYALFSDDDGLDRALDAGRKNPDFWLHPALVADAKAWHVNLDRPTRVGSKREYPPEQIEWYLDRSRKDFGILTNGRLWRLVPRELRAGQPRFQTYLEVNLVSLIKDAIRPSAELQLGHGGREFDNVLRFFLLFSPHAFTPVEARRPLILRAIEGSSEYSLGVSEELKERVFEALRLCVEGFIAHKPNGLDPAVDLAECQRHAFILLYRLLFILYAEDRGLLPYRINMTYTRNRSLARHRDEIAAKLDLVYSRIDRSDYSRTQTHLWDDLQDLFDLIDRGHGRYGVPAYNGGLFNLEGDAFLAAKSLPDWYLARVLDQLGRAPQPGGSRADLLRVDYRDLAIQQLGSVYEGLLELKPSYAAEAMTVVRKQKGPSKEEKIQPAADTVPKGYEATGINYEPGNVYLATDKGERRATGSYYTPDHIVNYIVETTLGAVCREVHETIERELEVLGKAGNEEARNKIEKSFDDRVLALKVLDPAMGSGHFLIRACQYLAEEIATNPYTGDDDADAIAEEESTITFWKRKVAERCLFGVDANPMAVELAKLALWLETVAADAPLTFLDHHLQYGNSLIGARINWLNGLPGDPGLFEGQFQKQMTAALPSILKPLAEITAIPSDTAEQVKQKEQIYYRRFHPALDRFTAVADIWCSNILCQDSKPIAPKVYQALIEAVRKPKAFTGLLESDVVQDRLGALADTGVQCFHWDLGFPQVFLGNGDAQHGTGFDVILGNPPYDVISEKESGKQVLPLKEFILHDATLKPARVGKNNLYKLFVARSLNLLANGGYLSFIVPMSLLGDEGASGIRRLMFTEGSFCEIHAFPQKDSVTRRVFPDAKLATCLFAYRRSDASSGAQARFRSQVHPDRFIEETSPALLLDGNSVKVYDPENLTIVSCTQEDWDLMASLPNTRLARLGQFAEFFQGEVNQTIAKSKGLLTEPGIGKLVTRGANISLYQLREASQGEAIYVDVDGFLRGRGQDTKAFHHKFERVGLQESCPQNNFRRIIACRISSGEFCNHTINYTTTKHSRIDLALVLFVLNSSFADWYFRLGSTNAHVNHYQIKNIPCPSFDSSDLIDGKPLPDKYNKLIKRRDFAALETASLALANKDGCSPELQKLIIALVRYIEQEEAQRGDITRTERSALAEDSATCQVILDKIMLILVGLESEKHDYITARLGQML